MRRMDQLTEFIATCHHAPCCCTLEFRDFFARFFAWLPENDRWKWSKRETARALRETQELFRGNDNLLFVADLSFLSYNGGDADESRMSKRRNDVRFIDDGANGYFMLLDSDGVWRRISLPQLCYRLCQFGRLTPEDVYQLRKYWRANAVRPTDSFANPIPEFLNAHYCAGRAVPLASLERRFPGIRTFLDARFPTGMVRGVEHAANLTGQDSIHVDSRELVASFGELLPRDLTPHEMESVARSTQNVKPSGVLTRNQMSVRGWDRRPVSRAQWLATMKTD